MNSTLRPDENPTVNVPNITTPIPKRKEPAQRRNVVVSAKRKVARAVKTVSSCLLTDWIVKDTAVQTEFDVSYSELHLENTDLKKKLEASKFQLCNIKDDKKKIQPIPVFLPVTTSCIGASCQLFNREL